MWALARSIDASVTRDIVYYAVETYVVFEFSCIALAEDFRNKVGGARIYDTMPCRVYIQI